MRGCLQTGSSMDRGRTRLFWRPLGHHESIPSACDQVVSDSFTRGEQDM